MSDTASTSTILVSVTASGLEGAWLTSNGGIVTYGGREYLPVPSMSFGEIQNTGALGADELKIESIPILPGFLTSLANHMPYSKVSIKIIEIIGVETAYLFNGLLYQVEVEHATQHMNLVCKDLRYYLDITAGIPCTEQCAALYFGDKICAKNDYSESHTVASVSGVSLTIAADLNNTTPLLFNKGYIEQGTVRIKIKYHDTGRTFQLSNYPPSSWEGGVVAIHAGCDRRLITCRTIHNNESRFMGLGYSMVDYNAMYESP